jgi:hypothetical protein
MILEFRNLLPEKELNFLNLKCLDFDNHKFEKIDKKNSSNNYNRVFVGNQNLELYYSNLKNILEKSIDKNKFNLIDFSKNNSWINRVILETNKNDEFHYDISYLTAVTYLNHDFKGGSFEYKTTDSNTVKIKPEINKTLIMDEKLFHRVLPVKEGIRHSLVTFFQFTDKEKKTLL